MIVLRLIGSTFLLIAALSLVHDVSLTVQGAGGLKVTSLGDQWYQISRASMMLVKDGIRSTSPWLWDSLFTGLLAYPAWLLFGLIGAGISFAGRKRQRTNIFAN